jgi:hypothetical protein
MNSDSQLQSHQFIDSQTQSEHQVHQDATCAKDFETSQGPPDAVRAKVHELEK